eukprot:TRINITY_DN8097_c0_g1_i1.p1 TRINITY_DN8097_c0_g1~~TRINITY_DN8097_c0_g1_i1.p1  ORF type:complete len:246 (-),score=46.85 TRINITY_DN8097_c0_g1_i1:374-1111(-)
MLRALRSLKAKVRMTRKRTTKLQEIDESFSQLKYVDDLDRLSASTGAPTTGRFELIGDFESEAVRDGESDEDALLPGMMCQSALLDEPDGLQDAQCANESAPASADAAVTSKAADEIGTSSVSLQLLDAPVAPHDSRQTARARDASTLDVSSFMQSPWTRAGEEASENRFWNRARQTMSELRDSESFLDSEVSWSSDSCSESETSHAMFFSAARLTMSELHKTSSLEDSESWTSSDDEESRASFE